MRTQNPAENDQEQTDGSKTKGNMAGKLEANNEWYYKIYRTWQERRQSWKERDGNNRYQEAGKLGESGI